MPPKLVFNADDLGLTRGATEGVIRAHQEGVVTSASLVTTTADYGPALARCRKECPALGLGLHFTLSAGRAVSPGSRVPLLVDERGFLRWRFSSLLRAVGLERRQELLEQIEVELEAQLDRLTADGVRLDHIDSERHIHQIPGIFERVVAAAERRGIGWIRLGREVGWRFTGFSRLAVAAARGGILKSGLLSALSRHNRARARGLTWSRHFASYLYSGRLHDILEELARDPPAAGAAEVMVHPGVPELSAGAELGNPALERYLRSVDRSDELRACIEARSWLSPEMLSTFRQLEARPAAQA